jgi:glutaminyl-tRNA synthetase
MAEPGLIDMPVERRFQFMRQGYFFMDADSRPERLVYNRIVSLRDSWAKVQKA